MNGYCNIFIYKNCKILKDRNFKVDDIDTYLSGCETLNVINSSTGLPVAIQGEWMKHALRLKYIIRIPISERLSPINAGLGQTYLSFLDTYNFNYLTAQNLDPSGVGPSASERKSTKVYYFIVGKKWSGENALELELEMDVINTLIDNATGISNPSQSHNLLILNKKTTILREHRDRYELSTGGVAYKKIDFYSEGINPVLFKTKESIMRNRCWDESTPKTDDDSWYLIYRSEQNPEEHPDSAIGIFICTDENKIVEGSPTGYNGHRDPVSDLKGENLWYIYGSDGDGQGHQNTSCSISFTARDGYHIISPSASQCIVIGKKQITILNVGSDGSSTVQSFYSRAFSRFRDIEFTQLYYIRKSNYLMTGQINTLTYSMLMGFPADTSFPASTSDAEIGCITDIDRTDPKLLKIIKLPYCPIGLIMFGRYGEGLRRISLPANWGVKQGDGSFPTLIYYNNENLTDAFKSELELVGTDNLLMNPYESIFSAPNRNLFGTIVARNNNYESKLWHSDYFQRKFVYDSFAYIFRPEFMNRNTGGSMWRVNFFTTATMNSKMYFKFLDEEFISEDSSITLKTDIQDYSGILYVARNNELPIFNSAFLNYIRTGYNYDIKTKNRQLASNIVGGVLSTAGAVASALSSTATGPMGVAGAIGLGISATQKFYNAISHTAQAEQNIAQKLKSTEMQGLSVIGGDDVDLMSEFTNGNKGKLVQYEVSERMKGCLADLFYYCGYIANHQGIPDTTSRMWFNFVQAEVVFDDEQNFPQELLSELKAKFREGITYLHKIVITSGENTSNLWDFEQQYENWETSLLPS